MSQSKAPSPNHWAADIKSGFLIFLIAMPLCLGIAMASGFPPVAGVLTAIVGGVVASFLGSAPLTIKGPAAGLIVIALGTVQELGQGDLALGYRRALAVGVCAASLQVLLSLLRAATVGVVMSPSVVHGMLAAIGVIIISKQVHVMLGVSPEGAEPLELLAQIPHSLRHANPAIAAIGVVAAVVLFGLPRLKHRWVKAVPTPMVVLALAVPLGLYFNLGQQHTYQMSGAEFEVGPRFLVNLPGSLLDALTFPDFSVVFSAASLKYVLMFTLVGTIESTLSVLAVDAMDPEKRPSNLNRDLFAAGVGNLISAFIGGLPMISEIVRSKANIDAGAKSAWANFSHGLFLLVFVSLVPHWLHHIPLAALAAMLVYTGARLASPKEFAHAKAVGLDQLALFLTTLVVTLASDLLIGVGVGIALEVVLHAARGASPSTLFRTKVESNQTGNELTVTLRGAAAFPSLLAVRRLFGSLAPEIETVYLDLHDVVIADHTFLSRVDAMADEWPRAKLEIVGVEDLRAASPHPHATRRRV